MLADETSLDASSACLAQSIRVPSPDRGDSRESRAGIALASEGWMTLRVLVPHDLGTASDDAFRWAVRLVRAEGGRIDVFHAVPLVPPVLSGPEAIVAAFSGADLDSVRDALLARIRIADAAVDVDVVVAPDPGEAIVLRARRTRADLVVMGTHGRSPVARAVLGSVADYVVRHADCPVLTVRHETPASKASR
jgi:nucleotide-binding universal stress UspA family protein